MMWRFGFNSSSIDVLLSRDIPPSVEEVMDESDVLAECKAQNTKLVNYLSRDDVIKSLLNWVVSGMDELDQEDQVAEGASLDHIVSSPTQFPSYHPRPTTTPGAGPSSPPLEPSKLGEGGRPSSPPLESPSQPGFAVGLGDGFGGKRGDDANPSRYPQVATEILISEVWTIPDTIMSNKDYLLRPFWDAVLPQLETPSSPSTDAGSVFSRFEPSERQRARDEFWSDEDEDRDRKREVIRGHWARINASLLAKRTHEMMRFIQGLPNVIERMMAKISSPGIQDLLIRIVNSEVEGGVPGVIEWLHTENLIPRLLPLLSPDQPPSIHTIACDLLKSIVNLCAPVPFNPAGGNAAEQQGGKEDAAGVRDTRLVRDLASRESLNTLIGYMLDDLKLSDALWQGTSGEGRNTSPSDPFIIHPLPSISSAASSLSNICNILVELVRRNNSDFSEPHLFHTLRNRLMSVRMQNQPDPTDEGEGDNDNAEEEERKKMEVAMEEMSQKMGIVYLGNLLDIVMERFGPLHRILAEPRSAARLAAPGTPGESSRGPPLTMERFRVVELYAELLHSSNMSIVNRPLGTGPVYTSDGILTGGLAGLEALGEAIDGDRVGDGEGEGEEEIPEDKVTQARELPVSSASTESFGSADVASEDEKMLEDIEEEPTPSASPAASTSLPPRSPPLPSGGDDHPPSPNQPSIARLQDLMDSDSRLRAPASSDVASASHAAIADSTVAPSIASLEDRHDDTHTPGAGGHSHAEDEGMALGDRLKSKYISFRVLNDVVELFFNWPNNNFLHHVVYDLLQQILNGRLGPGLNRELVIDLVRDARLVERILQAQKDNDAAVARGECRIGYMGHVNLLSEEIVKFFARCPPALLDIVRSSYDQEAWDAYVHTTLAEIHDRNVAPLAGGKPMPHGGASGSAAGTTSEDSSDEEEDDVEHKFGEPLTRMKNSEYAHRGEDSFGDRHEGDDEGNTVERYWGTVGANAARRHVDSSDEEDDDADWLRPNLQRQGSDDDEFGAFHVTSTGTRTAHVDFDDDDAWGTFNTAASPSQSPGEGGNPFGDDNFAPSVPPLAGPTRENLTPADWASAFDEEFSSGEPMSTAWTAASPTSERSPASPSATSPAGVFDRAKARDEDPGTESSVRSIVVPPLDDEDGADDERSAPHTPGSTWSFTGEDEGEDLPPTDSPAATASATVPTPSVPPPSGPVAIPTTSRSTHEALREAMEGVTLSSSPGKADRRPAPPPPARKRATSTSGDAPSALQPAGLGSSPGSAGPARSGSIGSPSLIPQRVPSISGPSGSSPIAIPGSSNATTAHQLESEDQLSPLALSRILSPPDSALAQASSPDAPLGPGVSPDTTITPSGMLQKEVDGQVVTVPADEVVLGVDEEVKERRASMTEEK